MSAYISPAIESEERFSLAVHFLVGVDFAMDRFGWENCQVDKLLKSVIRAMEEKYFDSHRVKLLNKGMVSTYKRVEEAIRKGKFGKFPVFSHEIFYCFKMILRV